MAIQLRPYQQDLLDRVRSALDGKPFAKVMLQLPTGGGKTHIAGELLSGWLKDGRKAVWLTHREELTHQTQRMLQKAGVSATANKQWTPGQDAPDRVNGVVILMAQTVDRRTQKAVRRTVWGRYNPSDLMIVDEAHHAAAKGWERAIRQWPGPVLGMTATPWRLSEKEGFDHLFHTLRCGPQVADLQPTYLCPARVLVPPEEDRIQGGKVSRTRDYSESGIESANQDRDIWTAGALRYWQKHGEDRQTIVYAVSKEHAKNLVAVFNAVGIPTGLLLSDTPTTERTLLLKQFEHSICKVLVNVAIATEGFDLPDAACVVLTRPTMSLSLYLQMVGRGLRPKQDCVILDLAGNSLRHGLPEEERQWSLQARGAQPPGDAPVVRCDECDGVSPAASQQCNHCGAPFGEPCGRCGKWRAWKRWTFKDACGTDHDLVCDLCHYDAHIDAHIQTRLPTEELKELMELKDDDELPPQDDELSPYRDPFLKNFLEEEWRRVVSVARLREDELRSRVKTRESMLGDDKELKEQYGRYLGGLPEAERPQTFPQNARRYTEWEVDLRRELKEWRKELATLETQSTEGRSIDPQVIVNNAREQLMQMFDAEAREAGLLPKSQIRDDSPQSYQSPVRRDRSSEATFEEQATPESGRRDLKAIWDQKAAPDDRAYMAELERSLAATRNDPKERKRVQSVMWSARDRVDNDRPARPGTSRQQENPNLDFLDTGEWMSFAQLADWGKTESVPDASSKPDLLRVPDGMLYPVNDWIHLLVQMSEWLNEQVFECGERLSSSIYLEAHWTTQEIVIHCGPLVEEFGLDPTQFHVRLRLAAISERNERMPRAPLDPLPKSQIRYDSSQSFPTLMREGPHSKAIVEEQASAEDRAYLSELQAKPNEQEMPTLKKPFAPQIERKRTRVRMPRPLVSAGPPLNRAGWRSFHQLAEWGIGRYRNPILLQDPREEETLVSDWTDLLVQTSEWLIREGLLKENWHSSETPRKYLFNAEPIHPDGRGFSNSKQLSNGLYLETDWTEEEIARNLRPFVKQSGLNPTRFFVWLR